MRITIIAAAMIATSHGRHLHLPAIILGVIVVCLIGVVLYMRSRRK